MNDHVFSFEKQEIFSIIIISIYVDVCLENLKHVINLIINVGIDTRIVFLLLGKTCALLMACFKNIQVISNLIIDLGNLFSMF